MEKTDNQEQKKRMWPWILSSILLVVSLWSLSWFLIVKSEILLVWSDRGTFGDMFGAVNSLFSGLAFAGIIIALIFQKQELTLQRKELRDTREELKGQREQMPSFQTPHSQ